MATPATALKRKDDYLPEQSRLAQYITDLYKEWSTHRKANKEIEWQKNLDNFLAINDEVWKKKDAERTEEEQWRCKVFVRLTKMKVVNAKAVLTDLILQAGKIPFMLKPNPDTYGDELEVAEEVAEKQHDKIESQFEECGAVKTFMKCVDSLCLYGECQSKSPVIKEIERKGWRREAIEGFEDNSEYARWSETREIIEAPTVEYKSVWNIYEDPEEDENNRGRGKIERIMVSAYDLQKMKGAPFYNDEAIDKVIKGNVLGGYSEDSESLPPHLRDVPNRKRNIRYLEFWGRVPKAFFENYLDQNIGMAEKYQYDIAENLGDDIEVMIGVAGENTIIRLALNDGERPYHKAYYEEALDVNKGIGVADNTRDSQLMVNGMTRNYSDNIALSANVMTYGRKGALAAGVSKDVYPGKHFEIASDVTDIRQGMGQLEIKNVSAPLLEGISLWKQNADEESNLPRIMQGDTAPKKKPDTLGEINLLMQSAGRVIGQVVKNLDEGTIKPWVEDFYYINMLDNNLMEIQGDFKAHALGFNSYQNKALKVQALQTFLALILSDERLAEEAKYRPFLEEIGKALDLDPEQYLLSDEEKEEQQLMLEQQKMEEEKSMDEAVDEQVKIEEEVKDNELERDLVKENLKSDLKIKEDTVKQGIGALVAPKEDKTPAKAMTAKKTTKKKAAPKKKAKKKKEK